MIDHRNFKKETPEEAYLEYEHEHEVEEDENTSITLFYSDMKKIHRTLYEQFVQLKRRYYNCTNSNKCISAEQVFVETYLTQLTIYEFNLQLAVAEFAKEAREMGIIDEWLLDQAFQANKIGSKYYENIIPKATLQLLVVEF